VTLSLLILLTLEVGVRVGVGVGVDTLGRREGHLGVTLSLLILLRVVLTNVAVAVVVAPPPIAPPILHMQPGAGQETKAGRARGQVAIQCAARRKSSRLKRVGGAHRRRRTVTRGGE
jgi:hypothetical protein